MKKSNFKRRAGVLTLSTLAFGLIASTQEVSAATMAGNVANTRHNLSSVRSGTSWGNTQFGTNTGDIYTATGSDQICVFCHTPHGSNTAFTDAPLWNRNVAPTTVYTLYSMVGSNSTGTPTAASLGMALACLSCHDGTQAMDAMLNAPGFGGAATPGYPGTKSVDLAAATYTWTMGSTGDAPGGTMTGNGAPMLGTDLSNDHPIGMLYCGGGATNEGTAPASANSRATTCSDPDFMSAVSGGVNRSYVPGADSTGGLNIKLYGATLATSVVLCGSCHDPHIDTGDTRPFLRQAAAGSTICLTCHTK